MGVVINYYAETANDEINPINIAAGLTRSDFFSIDDLAEIAEHLLTYVNRARLKSSSDEIKPPEITYGDIYREFQHIYPEVAQEVKDYRPYFPPYRNHVWPMNIVIWLKDGNVKRYSYETKCLYPDMADD